MLPFCVLSTILTNKFCCWKPFHLSDIASLSENRDDISTTVSCPGRPICEWMNRRMNNWELGQPHCLFLLTLGIYKSGLSILKHTSLWSLPSFIFSIPMFTKDQTTTGRHSNDNSCTTKEFGFYSEGLVAVDKNDSAEMTHCFYCQYTAKGQWCSALNQVFSFSSIIQTLVRSLNLMHIFGIFFFLFVECFLFVSWSWVVST